MRFLVDECTGSTVARWLREQGHEVFSVFDEARGASDDAILQKALDEDWILITNDRDFGEKVYRGHYPHHGIVFLRLADKRATIKVETLRRLLDGYADRLHEQFVVVTEVHVRFEHTP